MSSNLRVWHIPQVPGEPFYIFVNSVEEAIKILDVLDRYDAFQFENRIKPDYASVNGLEIFENGEWSEWHDGNDYDIDHLRGAQNEN